MCSAIPEFFILRASSVSEKYSGSSLIKFLDPGYFLRLALIIGAKNSGVGGEGVGGVVCGNLLFKPI